MVGNLFGLIGFPLGHSFSKAYFNKKFFEDGLLDYKYELFPITSIEELPRLLIKYPSLRGLNVTIPYKESVLPYLQTLDFEAREIGAVNVIQISHSNILKGYNTDVYGFRKSLLDTLEESGLKKPHALILGNGGSAKAVKYVLKELGIPFQIVSRIPSEGLLSYESLKTDWDAYNLIVNCTPVGMYPNLSDCPAIPYEKLRGKEVLFDLIYNPEETTFLQNGKNANCFVKNGLDMLIFQAEKAWEIWKKSDLTS